MKRHKRFISFFTAIVLCASVNVISASAVEEGEIITFDEYATTLKETYRNLGFELELTPGNSEIVYTRTLLEKDIENAYAFADSMKVEEVSSNIGCVRLESEASPHAMLFDFYYERVFVIQPDDGRIPLANAKFTVTCGGVFNLQNDLVISVDYCTVENSYSLNMSSEDVDIRYAIYDGKDIQLNVSGEVEFSWTDPSTGIMFTSTRDGILFADNFYPGDYII